MQKVRRYRYSAEVLVCSSIHIVMCSAIYFEIQAFVIPVILLVLIAVTDGIKYVFYESERHHDVSGQKIRPEASIGRAKIKRK